MTWLYKGEGTDGFPGVPARDLSDEEFYAYAELYDAQFTPGALAGSQLYVHKDDKPAKAQAAAADDGGN